MIDSLVAGFVDDTHPALTNQPDDIPLAVDEGVDEPLWTRFHFDRRCYPFRQHDVTLISTALTNKGQPRLAHPLSHMASQSLAPAKKPRERDFEILQ